jgi:glycosyltransferase involved in cell wall biosynthesis
MTTVDWPTVTVILPVRQEGAFIRRSLGCVLAQDYPAERLEILVADGRSTDGTRQAVVELQAQHPRLRLVDNPGLVVPTGLNAALRQASGEIIVRVDGHTEIAPDYVRQCVIALRATGADNVGGRMNATGEGPFGEAVALASSTPFGVGNARFHYSSRDEWVDTVYMGAWPRAVFTRIGLFDEELVRDQDDEFNYRLLQRGGRIWLSQSIRSRYTNRSNPRALWRQYFQYGYWKVRVMQKHTNQMRLRQFVPAAFVATLAASTLLTPFWAPARVALGLAVGSYAVANVAASVVTARRHGGRHLRRLPVVFAILHLSYGSGFLAGLARFWDRWKDRGRAYRMVEDTNVP